MENSPTLKAELYGNVQVISLYGRFDAFVVPQANAWLSANVTAETPRVVLDLEHVNFVDTLALATFVKWMKRTRDWGGDLKIANLSQPVQIIFELSRLDKAFQICQDTQAAIAQFEAS